MQKNAIWKRAEVLLLFDLYDKLSQDSKLDVESCCEQLSAYLRASAQKRSTSVSDTYRNLVGIKMKLENVRFVLTGKGLSGASKLDKEIAQLYKNNRVRFINELNHIKSLICASHSWRIVSDNVAIKTNDKSVFFHNESGLPKEILWFWNAQESSKKIILEITYNEKSFVAWIVYTSSDGITRAKIRWNSDLGSILSNNFRQIGITDYAKTQLRFERIGINKYSMNFLYE